ncbi:hypothetical protein AAFF_G00052740, partial [Aldrovandia affinis]
MWFDFVQACIIICSRVISYDRLEVADCYLQTFLSKFVGLYGPLHCTPNMHLHLHLKDCMLDYGPVYAFWCFSFERINGMLGKYHNNNRNIEVQVMRHFQQGQQLQMPLQNTYAAEFINILSTKDVGSLSLHDTTDAMYIKQYSCMSSATLLLPDVDMVKALPPFQNVVLTDSDRQTLLSMYKNVYPDSSVSQVGQLAKVCSRVRSLGLTLCVSSRTERSACVSAKWCRYDSVFEEPVLDPTAEVRPGIVKQFLVISVKTQASIIQHVLAKMMWLDPHPD